MKGSIRNIAAGLCLAALASGAYAADAALDMSRSASGFSTSRAWDMQSYVLAANEVGVSNATQNVASATPAQKVEFQESPFTLNKIHRHLGIATIIAAVLTAATAPEGCEANCAPNQQRDRTGTHAKLARATVALASSTVFTGVLAHWDDIHLENGLTDPDNAHALLGLVGAALMADATIKSAKSAVPVSHAAQAELGAALMAVGIKLVW